MGESREVEGREEKGRSKGRGEWQKGEGQRGEGQRGGGGKGRLSPRRRAAIAVPTHAESRKVARKECLRSARKILTELKYFTAAHHFSQLGLKSYAVSIPKIAFATTCVQT